MDSYKVGIEADSEDCAESETLSISDTSAEDETSRNRGRELNKMKLRSIRLSRLPSLRSCMRPMKSPTGQCPSLLSGYAASSEQSTPFVMSDVSPNYTKGTSCSNARKGSFQKSSRMLSRRSSFKPMKSLTRMSSMKFRRPLMRKSSGGTDLKKTLKKTRSIKLASSRTSSPSQMEENAQYDQSSETDTSPKYSKAHFQGSPHNSEPSFSSNGQNRNSKIAKPKSDSSVRVLKRASTLRPQRILKKTASLKSKRPSKKLSEVSEISDSSVGRATCSSTLKDSKISHHIEHQTGGSKSGGISAVKVCPYTYCSLHGHRHGNLPPLKRFVSMRRRFLKAQKSMKPDSRSVPKAKRSSNRRKGTQTSQVVCDGDSADQQDTQDSRANSSVADEEEFKVEMKGAGTQCVEDKHIVSKNLTNVLLDEASHPHSGFQQHRISNSLTDKPCIQVALSEFNKTSEECCSIAIDPFKQIPEASYTKRKGGKIVAIDTENGDSKLICTVDHHEIVNSSLPELKDSIKSGNLPLKLDDIVSTSNEGAPVDGAVNQEVNGDPAPSFNLEIFKYDSELKNVLDVSTTTRERGEEENEDSDLDYCFHEGFSQSGDSTPNCPADGCHKTQIKNQKFTGFWGLIYQHMVSGIAAEVETQIPLNGKDKEGRDEEKHPLPNNKDPVDCQSSSGKDQDMGIKDYDAGDQKLQLWQSDAIKLVQEAFDKILSEIPEQSSDDQSICSETTSEQELLESKQGENGKANISCSFDGTNESLVQDPKERQLKFENVNSSEEGSAASQLRDKSSQQISRNWSNLKKVIILKRFFKALEKVRNFNPRKPQFQQVESDPETEKVHLRHQTTEERKRAEEWMLDHALRQVISKLAPAQKRKVALLVQAFETVTPLPEIRIHRRSNATASPHATPVQATDEQNNGLLSEASHPEMSISLKETLDQISDLCNGGQLVPGTLASEAAQTKKEETIACNIGKGEKNSMPQKYQLDHIDSPTKLEDLTLSDKTSSKLNNVVGTSHGELVNKKILTEIYYPEVHGHDFEFKNAKLESVSAAGEQACQPKRSTPENNVESTAVSSALTSTFSEILEAPAIAFVGEGDPEYEVLQESSQLEEPELSHAIDVSKEAKMEKQKYTRLWYLLYKHMVSTSVEGGSESLLKGAGADCKEQGGEANTFLGMKDADSCKNFSESHQEVIIDNQNGSSQKIECHQMEAIKLIEEAIDEIQLPEIQDDLPGDQSITGKMNPEMESQKNLGEDGEPLILTATDSADNNFKESNNTKLDPLMKKDSREASLNSYDITAQEESETITKLGNKSERQAQKSWNNLKKMILLKRFIKALEKVRKFNPREPRYQPLDPDSEAEKVCLRHQSSEDRKNAEEWMLDYALQQVVAKLTPARKRKVELLVEAFETVTPNLEVKNHQRQSAAASPHAKLIFA